MNNSELLEAKSHYFMLGMQEQAANDMRKAAANMDTDSYTEARIKHGLLTRRLHALNIERRRNAGLMLAEYR